MPQSVVTIGEINSTIANSPDLDLPFYRKLGRTDLIVSRLGLGGGGGISSEDTLYTVTS